MSEYYFYYYTGKTDPERHILIVKGVHHYEFAQTIAQYEYQNQKTAHGGLIEIKNNNPLIDLYPSTELFPMSFSNDEAFIIKKDKNAKTPVIYQI